MKRHPATVAATSFEMIFVWRRSFLLQVHHSLNLLVDRLMMLRRISTQAGGKSSHDGILGRDGYHGLLPSDVKQRLMKLHMLVECCVDASAARRSCGLAAVLPRRFRVPVPCACVSARVCVSSLFRLAPVCGCCVGVFVFGLSGVLAESRLDSPAPFALHACLFRAAWLSAVSRSPGPVLCGCRRWFCHAGSALRCLLQLLACACLFCCFACGIRG